MSADLFQDFDFSILDSRDFKEDSVREELIQLLLKALGYTVSGKNKIIRSKSLTHPYVQIGSTQRQIYIFPDYLLQVSGDFAWILDAKAPNENITSGKNVEQAYSYAIHPEIRVKLYALSNGREFALFHIDQIKPPILHFQLSEIQYHWDKLTRFLSPSTLAKTELSSIPVAVPTEQEFNYLSRKPLPEITDLKRQSAKRHFGIHPFFTKQIWNVVQEYIKNFCQPNDTVLDPFGGSGVTLIEALVLGRKAIHIDLNPLSIFLVKNLINPVSIAHLTQEFSSVKQQFEQSAPRSNEEIEKALATYPYPKGIKLPKNSDVTTVEQLFSPQQLAQLAYLKHLIKQVDDEDIQGTLLLMFSGLLNKINLTFHASRKRTEGQGDSSIFRYYRYRIAPKPALLDVMHYFELRLKRIIAGKQEIIPFIDDNTVQNAQVYQGTATNLDLITDRSIDYIYTDPPYGAKIPYLDLSTMWNSWLDLPVTEGDYALEAIEGGKQRKTKGDYSELIGQSINEMYRVLKFDRWLSFVFAHQEPAYWHLIVETAEKAGFEYVSAVKQASAKASFKKRQNPFTVLSGQLIINFRKVRNPKAIMKVNLGAEITDLVIETIEGVIVRNHGATIEEINNELIVRGLELGFLDILSKEHKNLVILIRDNFDYDETGQKYHIRADASFKTQIDVKLRIRYFLLSYIRRMEQQDAYPTFDEIILHIMPLLKNGITPENQTILNVLEDIAEPIADGKWRLKEEGQQTLLFIMN